MKPCDTGYCDIDRCSDGKCKEGMEAITEVVIAPMEQSAAYWLASAAAELTPHGEAGSIDQEKEKAARANLKAMGAEPPTPERRMPTPETLKKCYKVGAHYRKVTIYYSDWSGQMDHVDTFRPEKGLTPSARKKAVDAELESRGFFLA